MSIITEKTLRKVESLSELELDENERTILKKDMENMLEFVAILSEIDRLEDAYIVSEISNVNMSDKTYFREDVVCNESDTSILNNSNNIKDGLIVVPKTVE